MQKLVEDRWDVKAAEEDVKKADSSVFEAIGGHFPSLYAEGAYRLYQMNKTGPDYYFGLGAELPLFSGFITTAKVKEARSILRQTQLKLHQTKRIGAQDIVDSHQSWETSGKEVEAYKKAYLSAEESYRVSLNDYRLSLVTILDVITSLTTLQTTKDDYDSSLLQHKLNRIRLPYSWLFPLA